MITLVVHDTTSGTCADYIDQRYFPTHETKTPNRFWSM